MSHRRVGSYSKVHLAALLDRGELVGVAPGGGRECLLDTECSVLWHNRWRGRGHSYRLAKADRRPREKKKFYHQFSIVKSQRRMGNIWLIMGYSTF